jgi:hypothetical protein
LKTNQISSEWLIFRGKENILKNVEEQLFFPKF